MALAIPKETYNQQALAATQQMDAQIRAKAALIKADLPAIEAVIEISVESIRQNTVYIQRVAALRFNKSPEGRVQFNISVYKLENRPQQELFITDESQSQHLAILPNNTQLAAQSGVALAQPAMIAVINSESLSTMDKMDAEQRCPEARKVLNLLINLFQNGVPLPREESMVRYHVDILTRDGQGFIQNLSSYQGFGQHNYLSTSVRNTNNSTETKQLRDRFNHLLEVAKGNALPSSMEGKPGQVTSAIQSYTGQMQSKAIQNK